MALEAQHVIEAALLASRTPLDVRTLRRLFNDALSAKAVRAHLSALQAFWAGRGLVLEELPGGEWRFRTHEDMAGPLSALKAERAPKYSRAAMETLAVIAYRQPVTRGDIESIRGVAVNAQIIRAFEERGWIETVGWRETPGRPALLATTKTFLADLGLKSLDELPSLASATLEEAVFALGIETPSSTAPQGGRQTQQELDFEKEH